MSSTSVASWHSGNQAVESLPRHLQQFVVNQGWERYTAIDHAVWRYIIGRTCVSFPTTRTHPTWRGWSVPEFPPIGSPAWRK